MLTVHANAPWWWRQLDAIRHFFVFLIIDGPVKIFSLWQSTARAFEGQISVITTAQNITKPLFQDYTREGRLIGIIFRILRILFGVFIQIIIALVFIAGVIVWLILPGYIVYQLITNLASIAGLG